MSVGVQRVVHRDSKFLSLLVYPAVQFNIVKQ